MAILKADEALKVFWKTDIKKKISGAFQLMQWQQAEMKHLTPDVHFPPVE